LLLLLLAALPCLAATDVHIKVAGQGGDSRLLLGMGPFEAAADKPEEALLAKQLHDIVRADLLLSRYFNLLETAWKENGAGWLLSAKISSVPGQMAASVQLVDLSSGESIFDRY
jgi:hypothetical protein